MTEQEARTELKKVEAILKEKRQLQEFTNTTYVGLHMQRIYNAGNGFWKPETAKQHVEQQISFATDADPFGNS